MCGIIGYTGKRSALPSILRSLHALEYRGYDSAGTAFFDEKEALCTVKASGKISALEAKLQERLAHDAPLVHTAIGHTRWATHGAPTEKNAHPHGTKYVQIVHNGIIENYAELKEELKAKGYVFTSDTDTEVAALTLDRLYLESGGDALSSLAKLKTLLRGSYAIGVLFANRPHELYAIRRDNPLILGCGEEGAFIASDITAILPYTRDYYRLSSEEIACLTGEGIRFFDDAGKRVKKHLHHADWSEEQAERGGYEHFMRKEIEEEPSVLARALSSRTKDSLPCFISEKINEERLLHARRILLVGCGTAYHAGLFAKFFFEKYARMQLSAEIASEFRYADPILDASDAVILISQSGETADTLAALRLARERGAYTLGIVNAVGSSIAREADDVLYTYAGPEIAVASTKAYILQSALLALLGLHLSYLAGRTDSAHTRILTQELTAALPRALRDVLSRESEILSLARSLATAEHLFFIGRNVDHFAVTEASLKLKEISYIHSEAYAAGELKHGTISLIEFGTPVIALSTTDALREKLLSNCREVTSRGAQLFAVCTADQTEFDGDATSVFKLPPIHPDLAPIAAATVFQLLAYHVAVLRGCDVDQPRNLAKSVTVE